MPHQRNSNNSPEADTNKLKFSKRLLLATKIPSCPTAFAKFVIMSMFRAIPNEHISVFALRPMYNYLHLAWHSYS